MKYDAEGFFVPAAYDSDAPTADVASDALLSGRTTKQRRFALIGCYRPRQCGIATFTADVHDELLREAPDMAIDVYALRATPHHVDDTTDALSIDDSDAASYRAAAEAINRSGAEAVWLQHEFGIFGGPAGALVLELIDRVAAPLIVTLHTILAEPSADQRIVMDRLVSRASRIVVMSHFGRQILINIYGADPAAIVLIEHGAPDRPFLERSALRDTLEIGNRPILSTFGLLGPGKGLETAIRALPAIAAQYPDILYRIVGATHPNLIAAEGEAYRESLEALADSLGVRDNIAWDNRFLGTADLLDQIELCDIYLAPYPNLAQITSGTLAYAVALGRAVIATPFIHARELLADDVGIVLPHLDSESIAEAVLLLLAVPSERQRLQKQAYHRGRRTTWPAIAKQYKALLDHVIMPAKTGLPQTAPSLAGVRGLSDGVGILQHGCGIVPDRNHGYCIDDNARALMLEISLPGDADPVSDRWAIRYASFLQHAWNPDKQRFRNFMGFDRRWLEEAGSEDSNGRALWALGHCAGQAKSPDLAQWGLHWFDRTASIADGFENPRALAFALLGAADVLDRNSAHEQARAIVERGSAFLYAAWKTSRRPGWDWFEARLTYDNARLAEALIRAGRLLHSLPLEEAGLAALDWLCEKQTAAEGHFRPVGSEGFALEGETLPYDQQPLEAWATVAACGTAFSATRLALWRERAETAYRWFHGGNDRGIALADVVTGRCRDGLNPRGVNLNVGAESVLAFHLAYQTMNTLFWSRGIKEKAATIHADLQTRPIAPAYS